MGRVNEMTDAVAEQHGPLGRGRGCAASCAQAILLRRGRSG
jgi:hypothetical protein